jgi:ferritin-like metal-binding protein YciE
MNGINARDAKLIQYLNEAYGKEKQLETALEAHIALTTRQPYKKKLQQHLGETKRHGRVVERRIKELGGAAETVSVPGPDALVEAAQAGLSAAQRAVALAKGPLHALRGTGEQEKMLKNAKTEYSEEAEEIANYTAIESLARTVGDKETAKLARDIRREEERMASFLERLIPQLTTAVAKQEIPSQLRNGSTSRRRTSARRSTSSSRARRAATARRTSSTARRTSSTARRTSSSARRKTSARSRQATSRSA